MADPATPAFSPMSPPAPMAMQAPTARPGLVTAAGIVEIVEGALVALGGLLLIFFGSAIAAALKTATGTDLAAVGGALFAVVGIFVLIYGALSIFVGLQVLKGKNWARITTIVLGALGALGILTGNFIGGLIGIFLIVAMVVPASATWFKAMSGRPAA